jgi:hypothetical protein
MQVSSLDLPLKPTHPDGMAGLHFLGTSHRAFTTLQGHRIDAVLNEECSEDAVHDAAASGAAADRVVRRAIA